MSSISARFKPYFGGSGIGPLRMTGSDRNDVTSPEAALTESDVTEVCSAHARKWGFPALFSGVFGYCRGFSLCCVVLLGYFLSRPRSHCGKMIRGKQVTLHFKRCGLKKYGKMIRGKQVTLQTILKEHKEF